MHEVFLKTVENSDFWLVDEEFIREAKYNKDGTNESFTYKVDEFIENNKNHPILDILNEYILL